MEIWVIFERYENSSRTFEIRYRIILATSEKHEVMKTKAKNFFPWRSKYGPFSSVPKYTQYGHLSTFCKKSKLILYFKNGFDIENLRICKTYEVIRVRQNNFAPGDFTEELHQISNLSK